MAKHVHAELMAQYAQDALTSETPWELWEVNYKEGEHVDWLQLNDQPNWRSYLVYRRKPQKKKYVKFEVPVPVKKEDLAPNTSYYTFDEKAIYRLYYNPLSTYNEYVQFFNNRSEVLVAHAMAITQHTIIEE